MRKLTLKQAKACENARTKRCRCRCGGAYHGAARDESGAYDPGFFADLPDGDPHKMEITEGGEAVEYWIVLTVDWPHPAPYPLYDWYVAHFAVGAPKTLVQNDDFWEQLGLGPFGTYQEAHAEQLHWLADELADLDENGAPDEGVWK